MTSSGSGRRRYLKIVMLASTMDSSYRAARGRLVNEDVATRSHFAKRLSSITAEAGGRTSAELVKVRAMR